MTVAVDPASEDRLLAMAATQSLQKLRDEAARIRAAAEPDPEERHRRIRRSRYWRRWTDREGARCGSYRMTPEDAAMLEAAAQPFIDAALDLARREGRHEPSDAYAADGLVAMAASTTAEGGKRDGPDDDVADDGDDVAPSPPGPCPPKPRGPRGGRGRRRLGARRKLIGIVDLAALRRGSLDPGEVCEIAGIGPVPVSVARDVFGDALLRIVIRDGVDIRTDVHTGRTASAVQETAVLVRDGGRCIRPPCALPISEVDHVRGYARTGPTTLDDLAGLCASDHDRKSYEGHTYRRGPRGWEWHTLDGAIEYERPPPGPTG